MTPGEVLTRFGFGAGTSVGAALIGAAVNPKAGGLFLAFPSILTASLTLLERKEGLDATLNDVRGAIAGALGLVAFAVVPRLLAGRLPAAFVLMAAMAAWIACAAAAHFAGTIGLRRFRAAR